MFTLHYSYNICSYQPVGVLCPISDSTPYKYAEVEHVVSHPRPAPGNITYLITKLAYHKLAN